MKDRNNDISINSSKNDVAEFFKSKFKLSEKSTKKIIEEDISGEILPYLEKEDYNFLGIMLGPMKKIQNYLRQNNDKFKPNPIDQVINIYSSQEVVKIFFEEYLCFQGELNKMDGKKLFNSSKEELKNLGLNLGQRKKLLNYIQDFKNLKNIEKPIIQITKESKEEEVGLFLKEKLNFSEGVIKELSLDGESIVLLTEEEIDNLDLLKEKEKEDLKQLIKKLGGNEITKEVDNNKIKEPINMHKEYEKKNNKNETIYEKHKNSSGRKKNEETNNKINNYINKEDNNENNIELSDLIEYSHQTGKEDQMHKNIKKNPLQPGKDNRNNRFQKNINEGNNIEDKLSKKPKRNKSLNYKRQEIIKVKEIKNENIKNTNKKDIIKEKEIMQFKKEYKGVNFDNKQYIIINSSSDIEPMIKNSKYNVFFILVINENEINYKYSTLST